MIDRTLASRARAATRPPSASCWSRTGASCTRTATGCSAPSTTPTTRCRTPRLRAWRGLTRFEGRSSLRSWLYTIATNTCLTHIERRPKRTLPVEYGPATDPHTGPGEPLLETVWIEPYPDAALEVEQRESIELAFIAALQHLPATQRAVLILREVLGFTRQGGRRCARDHGRLGQQRAAARACHDRGTRSRSAASSRRCRRSATSELSELVTAYVDAWERGDVDAVVELLAEDATFAMPPLASWFGPRDEIRDFLARYPMNGTMDVARDRHDRQRPARARLLRRRHCRSRSTS